MLRVTFLQIKMNKVELISAVQKSLGSSKADAERAVNAVIDGVKAGVKKTKTVQLIGFGTFKVATRKARTGVNPKTGEKIKIAAANVPKFTAGAAFKDAANRRRSSSSSRKPAASPGRSGLAYVSDIDAAYRPISRPGISSAR